MSEEDLDRAIAEQNMMADERDLNDAEIARLRAQVAGLEERAMVAKECVQEFKDCVSGKRTHNREEDSCCDGICMEMGDIADRILKALSSSAPSEVEGLKVETLVELRDFIRQASVSLDYHEMMNYEERIRSAQDYLVRALASKAIVALRNAQSKEADAMMRARGRK